MEGLGELLFFSFLVLIGGIILTKLFTLHVPFWMKIVVVTLLALSIIRRG